MPVTHVTWRDAHDIGAGTWCDEPIEPSDVGMVIESYGIILLETDDYLVIGHSRDTVKLHPRGGFAIPKAAIITREDTAALDVVVVVVVGFAPFATP